MPTFERSIEIKATPDVLFDLTQNYDLRLSWDQFLKEARLIGAATEPAVGARAWCVARNGLGMETEYVSFKRPEVVAIKMTKGPAVFESFAGSWRFEEAGPNSTRVIFRYHFSLRFGWLGALANPLMQAVLARETAKRLGYLKGAAETSTITERRPSLP